MTDFLTEKQTEALLKLETRRLPLPEGGTQTMTATRLLWKRVDLFGRAQMFTLDELVGLARMNMADTKYSFEEAFKSVVAYIDHRHF